MINNLNEFKFLEVAFIKEYSQIFFSLKNTLYFSRIPCNSPILNKRNKHFNSNDLNQFSQFILIIRNTAAILLFSFSPSYVTLFKEKKKKEEIIIISNKNDVLPDKSQARENECCFLLETSVLAYKQLPFTVAILRVNYRNEFYAESFSSSF